MKRILLAGLGLALCSAPTQAADSSKPADFSGNWILDAGQSKNLPAGLEAYSMAVTQDDQQLKVETSLKGDLRPMETPYPGGGQGSGSPGNYPGSPTGYPGRTGMGMPMPGHGGGMGTPGGGSRGPMDEGMPGAGMPGGGGGGSSRGENRSQAEISALRFYPPSAVYKLNGTESTAPLGGSDAGDATLKADWAKNRTLLKLSAVGDANTGQHRDEVQLKDQWKLSKDGQSLMVDRSVHSSEGSGTIHLVFRKQAADSATDRAKPR